MSKVVATHANPARATQYILRDLLASRDDYTPLRRGLPRDWTTAAGTHGAVQWDGTPGADPPIRYGASVRVTVWDADPNVAEDTAVLWQALLLAYTGGPDVARFRFQAGVLPGVDPDNKAPLAFFTVRADMRGRVT